MKKVLYGLILGFSLLFRISMAAEKGAEHDQDHPPTQKNTTGASHEEFRPEEAEGGESNSGYGKISDKCAVSPGAISSFAVGESYDYRSMVTYLASPGCQGANRQIGPAIARTVPFSNSGPMRLDTFAKPLIRGDVEATRRVELALAERMPGLLRENPMTTSEMLPLLGQLALLSPQGARMVLANMIQQELIAGNRSLASAGGKKQAAQELAGSLVKMGANESLIASELAESISEMAVLSQGRALSEIFPALGAAAGAEKSLVPTFNLTAGAFNQGIQKGDSIYNAENRKQMAKAVFSAIQAALEGGESMEPGATELNEAFATLLTSGTLKASDLKKIWKEAVALLGHSTNQTALAEAVALTLTPQFVFFAESDRHKLFEAAANYPEIATSIQVNFLSAWRGVWEKLDGEVLTLEAFNAMKDKYFEPLVAQVLELDPAMIEPIWLELVLEKGLVPDEVIEKRFPRYVLSYLDRFHGAGKRLLGDPTVPTALGTLTEDLAVLWILSRIHLPTLSVWVKKYEGQ